MFVFDNYYCTAPCVFSDDRSTVAQMRVVVVVIMVPAVVYAAATEGNVFGLFCTIKCFELPKVKQFGQ
jgi:hypothetical protein